MKRIVITLMLAFAVLAALAGCSQGCTHAYDGACDTTCNKCSATRSSAGSHTPATDDGDCTTAVLCKVCDLVVTPAKTAHEAGEDDGDCTTSVRCKNCNTAVVAAKACHEAREDDGDCTTAVLCKECDAVVVAARTAHVAGADDGDCTTAVKCKNCDQVAVAAEAAHEAGEDDGNCTTAIRCQNCDQVAVAAKAAHEAGEDDGDCTTAIPCKNCDKIAVSANRHHVAGADDGDCSTAVLCTACDTVLISAKAHDFSADWEFDAQGHWHICQNSGCDATDTVLPHISSGPASATVSETCTACGFIITPATVHTHAYVLTKYDTEQHWRECLCGDKAEISGHTAAEDDGDCTTALGCRDCAATVLPAKSAHVAGADDGDCTTAVKCKNCDQVAAAANAQHVAGADDGDCTTAVKCKNCDQVAVCAKSAHEAGADDGDCTTAVKCQNCDQVAVAAKSAHEAGADDGDCTTAVKCQNCDQVAVAANAQHVAGADDGDCTTAVKCKNCNQTAVAAYDKHTADEDGNCKTRHECARCSFALAAQTGHKDTDGDYLCDNAECKIPLDSVIVEIAYAYDRQGAQIPYDQLNARRSIYSTPEDATAQRTLFLDCSSFVNSVYREAFGVNIMPYEIISGASGISPSTVNYDAYARDNRSAKDVVGYWIPQDYPTLAEKEALADSIYENLQVGDVLTYRHGKSSGSSGHVYLYLGNDTFIHCAGAGSYEVNTKNPALSFDNKASEITSNGTIGTISFDDIFRSQSSSRYIFKSTSSDTVFSFGIIRPMARGLAPTEKTVARMAIAGMSMEKTSSVCENASVLNGSLLTYTITLQNTSANNYSNIAVKDILPEGVEYVSSDTAGTVEGNALSWTVSVAKSSTVKISYTVRITEETPGARIVSNQTYVSKIRLGSITHTVSLYSSSQTALIADMAVSYNGSAEFSDMISLIKAVYETFDITLFEEETAGEILDQLIDTAGRTCRTDTEISKMLVPNMYGGLDIRYGWLYLPSENEKTRLPMEQHLTVGDIIVADWDNTDTSGTKGSTVYLYAGNHTLVTVLDGVCTLHTIGDDIYTAGENKLISLLGYDRYAVLRPSMVTEAPDVVLTDLLITSYPTKMEYLNWEPFDPTGLVVSALLSNNEQKVLVNYEVSAQQITKKSNTVEISFGDFKKSFTVEVSDALFLTSVSDARNEAVGNTINVEGIVVGVAHEGKSNDMELLIKDLETDDIMAVRNIPSSYGTLENLYGYQKGDVIRLNVTVKKDTSTSTSYKTKKYLAFSSENGTKASTIADHIDEVTFRLDEVTTLSTWSDMKNFFKTAQTPYTYVKLDGDVFMQQYSTANGGTDPVVNYRVHSNEAGTASADFKVDGTRRITLRDDVMTAMLGENWTDLLVDVSAEGITASKGVNTGKEFYAVYIGGNGSYYQLVILDAAWITAAQ